MYHMGEMLYIIRPQGLQHLLCRGFVRICTSIRFQALKSRAMYFVGDSLSDQHFMSLECQLGHAQVRASLAVDTRSYRQSLTALIKTYEHHSLYYR